MRRPDLHEPGAAHGLTFCCHRRFAFLRAERTCAWLANAIDEARREHHFLLWAYVFMPEHVHLLVWPTRPDFSVSRVLKAIKQPVGTKAVAYLRQHAPDWRASRCGKEGLHSAASGSQAAATTLWR